MKLNLLKTKLLSNNRAYLIKNNETGKFVHGMTYEHVLDYVPGKKRRQPVSKKILWESDAEYYQDLSEINNIIKKIIKAGFSSKLETCEILSYHRIVGVIPVGKLNLQERKEKFEQDELIKRLKA